MKEEKLEKQLQKNINKYMNGFLLIDKPKGYTSHDIVAITRKSLNTKKVGHAGTLDPLATGLLILGINNGTRLLEFIVGENKIYQVELEFGLKSDTFDIEGTITTEWEGKTNIDKIDDNKIIEAIESFQGIIEQIPPIYSAIKINGKKAYELARQGVDFEIKKRKITISKITNITIDKTKAKFIVQCSSGTYIRSLVSDIGELLGCGAIMTNLRRTQIGNFNIDNAINIDKITKEAFLPLESILNQFHVHTCSETEKGYILNGQKIKLSTLDNNKTAITLNNKIIAIGSVNNHEFSPKKVFNNA